jgi:hypothetical protein
MMLRRLKVPAGYTATDSLVRKINEIVDHLNMTIEARPIIICHKCGEPTRGDYVHVERRYPDGKAIPPDYTGYIIVEWDMCNECWHELLGEWMHERNVDAK